MDSHMRQNGQFAISFDSKIEPFTTLVLHFQYKLVHKDTGYHLTPYRAHDGSQILLGATHMQACISPGCWPSLSCEKMYQQSVAEAAKAVKAL